MYSTNLCEYAFFYNGFCHLNSHTYLQFQYNEQRVFCFNQIDDVYDTRLKFELKKPTMCMIAFQLTKKESNFSVQYVDIFKVWQKYTYMLQRFHDFYLIHCLLGKILK